MEADKVLVPRLEMGVFLAVIGLPLEAVYLNDYAPE